jgi:hypothetical protein
VLAARCHKVYFLFAFTRNKRERESCRLEVCIVFFCACDEAQGVKNLPATRVLLGLKESAHNLGMKVLERRRESRDRKKLNSGVRVG